MNNRNDMVKGDVEADSPRNLTKTERINKDDGKVFGTIKNTPNTHTPKATKTFIKSTSFILFFTSL